MDANKPADAACAASGVLNKWETEALFKVGGGEKWRKEISGYVSVTVVMFLFLKWATVAVD
ncbi:hypothetical protein OUZ56_014719 [Daphnia magna]|uniref:Uncharacterized protein n=1 Tax=Daphnia magna TaxID=35525 RepID=A0ABR0AKM2_9CRUS|nr:hypothetical protein OUZ56_014719 [Daphnia magna]